MDGCSFHDPDGLLLELVQLEEIRNPQKPVRIYQRLGDGA